MPVEVVAPHSLNADAAFRSIAAGTWYLQNLIVLLSLLRGCQAQAISYEDVRDRLTESAHWTATRHRSDILTAGFPSGPVDVNQVVNTWL